MATPSSAAYIGGRIAAWLVLLLLALAVAYATAMVVFNWHAISV